MSRRYFVYILASRYKGTLYVGVTNNLSRRVEQHRAGAVPGFTREYRVYMLMYFEEYGSILEARARERVLKGLAARVEIQTDRNDQSERARKETGVPHLRCVTRL